MPLTAGARLGSYEIRRLLGSGGMGEVYLAEDQRLHRQVALKVLPADLADTPERRARFEREATAAASLNHPNICTVYEVGEADGRPFIAMEYVEGETLAARIVRAGGPDGPSLQVNEVLDIGIQIADALNEARKKHIVHRDLKSANVVLTPRGQVKVLDFGLAKQVVPDDEASQAPTAAGVTQEGMIVGTVAYMAPEQTLGRPVDHRSDIFSFGVLMYELLTGRLPFRGGNPTEILNAVLHQEPPAIARFNQAVPEALARVVGKMLAKEREDRYQSVHEVWSDLRRIKGETTSARRAMVAGRPRARWRAAWAVRLTMAVVIVGVAIALVMRWPARRGLVTTAEAASVVALPSKVYGPAEFGYLTDAVPASLSTHLGRVAGLETKVPPSNAEVEQVHGDLAKVADAYGAKACVLSSITVQGGRLVLSVQLVDPRTRGVQWSQQYEGNSDSYLELVRSAAEGLRAALRPGSAPISGLPGRAANAEAELSFRRGQYLANQYNNRHQAADFDQALKSLARALALDPHLADAAAEIAFLYVFRFEAGAPAQEAFPQIDAWAGRAVSIDPRCSKGWAALVVAENLRPQVDRRKALEYALKAAALGPDVAIAHNVLAHQPLLTLSLASARESHGIDPLYLYGANMVAGVLLNLGRPREALPYLDQVLVIEPGLPVALQNKVLVLDALGRLKEAAEAQKAVEAIRGATWDMGVQFSRNALLLDGGDAKGAQAGFERILGHLKGPNTPAYDFGDAMLDGVPPLARHGRIDDAFRLLAMAIARNQIPAYDWLMLNPYLEPLRRDPRFKPIAAKARSQFDEMLAVMNAARARGDLPKYLEQPLADILAKLGIKGA